MEFNSLISIATKEALQSDHQHKMSAIIFKGNRIISVGRNYSSRSVKKLHPRFTRWSGSAHAEVVAIIKARKTLKGFDIFVLRVNRFGELRLAKPCKYCLTYLDYVGIRKIYYTTNEGKIKEVG